MHVIGAGVMGGDIAAWCALRGISVTLQDLDAARIAPAIKRAADMYKKRQATSAASVTPWTARYGHWMARGTADASSS